MKSVVFMSLISLMCLEGTVSKTVEIEPPDYIVAAYTGGMTTPDLPHARLLDDSKNQLILRACLGGATLDMLAELSIDSLEQRLDRMCKGRVLDCDGSIFRPALPLLTETRQEILDSIADVHAVRLTGPVRSLLEEIQSCGDIEPDQRFHVLWSLIIDQCWYSIWEQLKQAETGPPQVVWVVDPPHEFAVGTNFWQLPGGSIVAATWSPNNCLYLDSLMPIRLELLRAAWQLPVNDSVGEAFLRRYGFLTDDGTYLGLTYHDSTSLASQLKKWRDIYSREVAHRLDLKSAATALDLPESQTFVILLHEIAYALFKLLAASQDLEFPGLLQTGEATDQTANLVSIRLVRRPLPEDEVMALFMANNYHGTDKIVSLIEGLLATNPDNTDMRLILGLSLYDLKRYDEAVVAFRELSAHTARDMKSKRLYDWSRIWLGHVYDATGQRARALKWYKDVESDGSTESIMSFGQYRIGPVDAVTWARERIAAPFRRH